MGKKKEVSIQYGTFFLSHNIRVENSSSLLCAGQGLHRSDLPAPTAAAILDYYVLLITATSPNL